MNIIRCLALSLILIPAAGTAARAATIHSGNYTMTIADGSTMGFSGDGDYAGFSLGQSPFHPPESAAYFFPGYMWGNGNQAIELTRTLSAQLVADEGKIFDKVYVGLAPGAFNNWVGGVYSQSRWTVNGGTYVGNGGSYTGVPAAYHEWSETGPNSGESTFYNGYWYTGSYNTWGGFWGTPEYVDGYYAVGAATFSLDLSIYAVTANDSSFNPPGLQFHFTYLDAPAPSSNVPDTGSTAGLMLLALGGMAVGAQAMRAPGRKKEGCGPAAHAPN